MDSTGKATAKAGLAMLLALVLSGCVSQDPGDSAPAEENGTPGAPPETTEGETLISQEFMVTPLEEETAELTVPPGSKVIQVHLTVDESAYSGLYFEGIAPECHFNGDNAVSLSEGNTVGSAECMAPKPGEYQLRWGIEAGFATGMLTVVAEVATE